MKKYFFITAVFMLGNLLLYAQKPPSADEVLKPAYEQAAQENKNVLLIFHASWCGWCRKMDSSIHDESVKSYFDKSFVITHLTVKESAGKKDLQNPGAEDFLNACGGKDLGFPFGLYWIKMEKYWATHKLNPA